MLLLKASVYLSSHPVSGSVVVAEKRANREWIMKKWPIKFGFSVALAARSHAVRRSHVQIARLFYAMGSCKAVKMRMQAIPLRCISPRTEAQPAVCYRWTLLVLRVVVFKLVREKSTGKSSLTVPHHLHIFGVLRNF